MKERIRYLRRLLDLTQQSFADKIGLKQNSVALIEAGKRNVSDKTILIICKTFNVNEQWLRAGEGEMFKPVPQDEELLNYIDSLFENEDTIITAAIRHLLKAYCALDEKGKQIIRNQIEELSQDVNKKLEGTVPVELSNELTDGLTINELYKKKMEEQEKLKNERPAL